MATAKQSLLDILNCVVCLESMGDQKLLSCQHTVCIECVGRLETRNGRLKCPICNKESTIPEGQVKNFPDSIMHKRLASVIKGQGVSVPERSPASDNAHCETTIPTSEKSHTSSGETEGTNSQPDEVNVQLANQLPKLAGGFGIIPTLSEMLSRTSASKVKETIEEGSSSSQSSLCCPDSPSTTATKQDLETLVEELDVATEIGNVQLQNAVQLLTNYSAMKETLDEQIKARKDEIEAHQKRVIESCQAKIAALTNLSRKRLVELEDSLGEITPHQCKIQDSLKPVEDLRKKLRRQIEGSPDGEFTWSAEVVKKAKSSLEELNSLYSQDTLKKGYDEKENVYRVGDQVRLNYKLSLSDQGNEFAMSGLTHESVGVVQGNAPLSVANAQNKVVVSFREKSDWVGTANALCHTSAQSNLPITRSRVRIKSSVKEPKYGWKSVKDRQSRGVLMQIDLVGIKDELEVKVDFPECPQWRGLYSEIELIPGSCGLEVGDKVRVSPLIPEPSRGWAGVNGSSVGLITKIDGPAGKEDIAVDFPECENWIGVLSDLEIVRQPSPGEQVQVKLSVSEPTLTGWGDHNHEHVGFLQLVAHDTSQNCDVGHVMFPGRPEPWICKMSELEIVRYQEPDYGSRTTEEDFMQTFLNTMRMAGGGWPGL